MKKSTYLVIIWSITAVCMMIGLVIHSIHYAQHVGRRVGSLFGWGERSGVVQVTDEDLHLTDAFHKIDIDGGVMDITLAHGDTFDVQVDYEDYDEAQRATAEIKNDKLRITQKTVTYFGIGHNVNNNHTINVVITTPDDIASLDVDLGVGVIGGEDLWIEKADFDLGVGTLTFQDCDFGSFDADCGTGTIELKGLENPEENYRFDIDAGLSSIDVLGHSYAFECRAGQGDRKIEIDSGVGSVSIECSSEE